MSCIPIQDFSLITLCDATKAGKLYSIVPDTGAGDFDVTRASTATYLGSDGLLKTAATNEPRIEFNPDGSYKGLLVEPSATNLVLRSEEFNNAYWTAQNGSVTANTQLAPDGTMTADTLTSNGGSVNANKSVVVRTAVTPVDSNPYTRSVFVKKGNTRYCHLSTLGFTFTTNRSIIFDFDDEVITFIDSAIDSASFSKLNNGWYRLSIVRNSTGATFIDFSVGMTNSPTTVTHNSGDTIHIWGAQAEAGSVATSYIPTVASTVTRAADVISKTGASALIGQTEGTLYAEVELSNFLPSRILEVNDGSSNNRMLFQILSNNRLNIVITLLGVLQVALTTTSFAVGKYKLALVYKTNDVSFFVNGILIDTNTTAQIPACNRIDLANALGTNILNDHIRAVAILPTAISEQAAINLTS